MKVILAYAEVAGLVPDQALVDRLDALARAGGGAVEHIALPDCPHASPQQRALPWQLLPVDAYGSALWAVNFPACVLRHANRRIWLTRAGPFGSDPRAPVGALRNLLGDRGEGALSIVVGDAGLAAVLGLAGEDVEIAPAVAQMPACPATAAAGSA
jgi:hypothetical protein